MKNSAAILDGYVLQFCYEHCLMCDSFLQLKSHFPLEIRFQGSFDELILTIGV